MAIVDTPNVSVVFVGEAAGAGVTVVAADPAKQIEITEVVINQPADLAIAGSVSLKVIVYLPLSAVPSVLRGPYRLPMGDGIHLLCAGTLSGTIAYRYV